MRLSNLLLLLLPACGALAGAAACSDPASSEPVSDAGAAADALVSSDAPPAASDAADAAVACNALTTAGVALAKLRGVAEAAPAPAGGAVEDGTYVLVESIVYGQPGIGTIDDSFRKIVITGGVVQTVVDPSSDRSLGDRTTTETVAAAGTDLTLQKTCPSSGAPRTVPFTFEKPDSGPARLITYATSMGGTVGAAFEKQ